MKKGTRVLIEIICIALLVALDQWTKRLAVIHLMDQPAFELIPGILQLYFLPGGNTGAAWGMLSGHQLLFVFVSVAIVAVILYMLIRLPADKKYTVLRILMVFIAAGGIGNMIDRVARQSVIDFIYIKAINFPIFNVADMYVSCAIVVLVLLFIFKYDDDDIKEMESYLKQRKGDRAVPAQERTPGANETDESA